MEASGERSLSNEKTVKGGSRKKMAAIAIVIVLIIAAILAAFALSGEAYVEPTAKFTATTPVTQGEAVSFDGSGSTGKITNYTWTMGDGKTMYSTTPFFNYTYTHAGKMIALLTVTDAKKSVTSEPKNIVVNSNDGPVNNITLEASVSSSSDAQYNYAKVGTIISFDGSFSTGYINNGTARNVIPNAITNYTWKLDGAVVNYTSAFVKNFTSPGMYVISLTVSNVSLSISNTYVVTVLIYTSNPIAGKTYVMVTIGEPDTLDPAIDYETAGGEILQNVYETLVWYNGSSATQLVPLLATEVPSIENGGISSDGMNYTFHLRQNVHFHDGNLMTSSDVKYSIQRLLMINDPSGPAWILGQVLIPGYAGLSSANQSQLDTAITTPDANTVVFHLTTPYSAFLYCMAYTEASIVSKAYVEAHGGIVKETRNSWMITHEAGTGPYSLVQWEPDKYILMQRNDNYWRSPAAIQYVIIKKVQDVNTREMMLFNGDADSAYIPRNYTSDVIGKDYLRVVQGKNTFNLEVVGLNQAINTAGVLDPGVPSTFFADINVRQAFASAFNYSDYLRNALGGSAIQPNGVIPSGMFGYNASIPKYSFDLQAAANYLKNATNPDNGSSYAVTGFTINLYYDQGNAPNLYSCQLLQAGLQALNADGLITGHINVTITALDWQVYQSAMRNNQLPILFLDRAPNYADPDDLVNPYIDSFGSYARWCGIVNDDLTNLSRTAAMELNSTIRAGMYSNISMQIYQNVYYIGIDQVTSFHVERAWDTGYYYNPMYCGFYYYAFDKNVT